MILNYTMTGSEMIIEGLHPGVDDLAMYELDPSGIEKGYGSDKDAQIVLMADKYNTDKIFIYENTGDPAGKQTRLYPGDGIQLSYSEVHSKNIFYATGGSGDVLHVLCR